MKRNLEKSAKDQRLALGARDGSNTICQTLNGHKVGVHGHDISPVCSANPYIDVSQDYVLSVAVSPDGQWVVSGSKDRSIQFWNIATGQAQLMLQGHKNSGGSCPFCSLPVATRAHISALNFLLVISIDLAKSGGLLASGSGDYQARIWSYTPART